MTTIVADEDLRALRSGLREVLEPVAGADELRRVAGGADRTDQVWAALRAFGAVSLGVPEAYGGEGLGVAAQSVVAGELGHLLAPAPYLMSSVFAVQLLTHAGTEDQRRSVLPGIASGEVVASVAAAGEDGDWDPARLPLRFRASGGGHVVDGRAAFVADGARAAVLLVVGRRDGQLCLGVVDAGDPAVAREPQPVLDPTRPMVAVDLRAAPVGSLAVGVDAGVRRALALATVVLAAEQVGGAEAALQMAVDYAGKRVQFDRPIGSFQAVKHLLADVFVGTASAAAAVTRAVALGDRGELAALEEAASVAKAFASDAFFTAARANVQVHGAIGFTWEHPAHLYLKRSVAGRPFLGSPSAHRERIAVALLDG